MAHNIEFNPETKSIKLDGKLINSQSVGNNLKMSEIKTITNFCKALGEIKGFEFKIK